MIACCAKIIVERWLWEFVISKQTILSHMTGVVRPLGKFKQLNYVAIDI